MKVSAPPDSIETDGALTPFASRISMGACRLSLANAAHAQTPAQPRTAIITLRFIPSPLPWPRMGAAAHRDFAEWTGIPAGMNRPPWSLASTPSTGRIRHTWSAYGGRHEPLRNRSPPRLRLTTFLAQPSGPNRADRPR